MIINHHFFNVLSVELIFESSTASKCPDDMQINHCPDALLAPATIIRKMGPSKHTLKKLSAPSDFAIRTVLSIRVASPPIVNKLKRLGVPIRDLLESATPKAAD